MAEYVQYEEKGAVAHIILDRPEKRNAFNANVVTELKVAFQGAAKNDAVKVVLLRANGKVFSAGADLGYLQNLQDFSEAENIEDSKHLMELYRAIYSHPKVVVAQIEGHAIAGGCGLATVCDFSFAVPEAKFGYTEVKIGFIPAIVMVFLLRKIGEGKAKELLLTGKLVDAEEAMEFGLINEIHPADEIADEVAAFVETLCQQASGDALRLTKQMIAQVQEKSLEEGLTYAAQMNAKARATKDCKAGIAAFLNKEKITWN